MSYDSEVSGFFNENAGGGGGAPSFKHENVGDTVSGEIVSMREMDQTHFSGPLAGQPIKDEKKGGNKKQLQVILATSLRNWDGVSRTPTDQDGNPEPASNDDGARAIYVRGWMTGAVLDAVRAKGEKFPRVGGRLAVQLTEAHDKQKQNPKKYRAKYEPPAAGAGMFEEAAVQADAQQAAQQSQSAPVLDDEIPFS